MKLMDEVSVKNTNGDKLFISKLDDLERKKFNNNFVVTRTRPTDDTLLREDTTKFLNELKSENYEGLFQTELECRYHVRLYEAMVTIKLYESVITEPNAIEPFDPFRVKFEQ
jgi:hypothetical protein